MWRGKDVLSNVPGCLVFGVPVKMHPIEYREPPEPPLHGGRGKSPPLAVHAY